MRDTGVEKVLRDLRVFRIFEGANDVLRLFISLTGLKHVGQHLTAASKSPTGVIGIAAGRLNR